MKHLIAITSVLLATTGSARAEGNDDDGPPSLFEMGLDYQRGTYDEAPGAMGSGGQSNATYALSIHALLPDADKATPLRSIPAIWLGIELGWMTAAKASTSGVEDGGGFLMDIQLAGPWAFVNRRSVRAYLGVGFNFGLEMGHPSGVERSGLAADAFAMGLVDVGSAKRGVVVEGEYAAGVGYNEQRLLGLVRLGKLGLGATLVAGQSDIDYLRIGAHLARTF